MRHRITPCGHTGIIDIVAENVNPRSGCFLEYNEFMWRVILIFCLMLINGILWLGCQHAGPKAPENLLAEVQQRGFLRVGVKYDSPPFGFLDADDTLKGFEIDLAREIARRLLGSAKAVQFVQVNTATRVATLNARQVDFVLATMTITPERAQLVNFTSPYYQAAQGVLVHDKSPIKTLQDLANKRVLYIIGATGEARLRKALPKATLLGFKSSTEAFSALHAGRGDAFSTDDSILYGFLHEYCGFRMLPERLSREPYGMAFRKDLESPVLQENVQAILTTLEKEGFLTELAAEWNKPYPPSHCVQAASR